MAEQPADPAAADLVRTQLHAIAQLLREAHRLEPAAQTALADLVDELSKTLEAPSVPSAEIARLTECTAQLVKAVHEEHAPGLLAAARNRLEHAVVAVETEAPGLASLTRRLAEMLSNVGL
jgi:hypothetical protein